MRSAYLILWLSSLLAVSAGPLAKRNYGLVKSFPTEDRVKRNQWSNVKRQATLDNVLLKRQFPSDPCASGRCPPGAGNCVTDSNGMCVECKDGSIPDGTRCGRVLSCSTKQECASRTGNPNAFCSTYPGGGSATACFVPSTNPAGTSTDGGCGNATSGDDNECAAGLSCMEFKCQCAGDRSFTNAQGQCQQCADGSQYSDTNRACVRVDNCSSNQDCVTKTRNANAFCAVGACFAPSTNPSGTSLGGTCYSGQNPAGDDNACATGLSCQDAKCVCSNPRSSLQQNDQCVQCEDGAVPRGGQCARVDNCTGDQDCRDRTGNQNAFCTTAPDSEGKSVCFSPSTNPNGKQEGEVCYSGQNPAGDDNTCDNGLICSNSVCSNKNVNMCGNPAKVCSPPPSGNGYPTCSNGSCDVSCKSGYTAQDGDCKLNGSGMPRAPPRKRSVDNFLCPSGETACPISGSASFSLLANQATMKGQGWECLDIQSDLSSCGGCASLGKGMDCSTMPHSEAVGCEAGRCVVFSCQAGYSVSIDGLVCNLTRSPISVPKRRRSVQKKGKTNSK